MPSLLTRTGDDRSTVTASQTCRTLTLTVLVQISAIVTIWRVNAVFCNTNYIINKFPTNASKHSSTEIHFLTKILITFRYLLKRILSYVCSCKPSLFPLHRNTSDQWLYPPKKLISDPLSAWLAEICPQQRTGSSDIDVNIYWWWWWWWKWGWWG